MLTKSIFLCLAVVVIKVTANPLLQPFCPQNTRNQQSPLQYILQQAPNNIQPYLQGLLAQNAPYNPQNPCSVCQAQNNQINPNVFNKILSNPALRSILDPNTRLYNQNGCEVPRNGPCGNNVPNVVNNYIIVPPEFLLEDTKCGTERDAKARIPNERKKQRIASNERVKAANQKTDNKIVKDSEDNIQEDKDRKPKRKKTKNPEIKVKIVNENVTEVESPKIEKAVENEKEVIVTTTENNLLETTIPTVAQQNKVEAEIESSNLKSEKIQLETRADTEQVSEIAEKERKNMPEEKRANKARIDDTSDSVDKSKRRKAIQNSNKNNRIRVTTKDKKTENAKEEAAIQDFRRKFPNIPEKLVRDLLDHMRKQLEKQQLGVPAFYYPQYPISYEQLYKPSKSTTSGQNTQPNNTTTKPRRRKNRRNQNKRRKQSNKNAADCQTVIELTPTVVKEEPIITEKVPIVATTTVKPNTEYVTEEDFIEVTTVKNDVNAPVDKNIDSEEDNLEEIETDHVVPIYYYPEYYPDFTNDKQYLTEDAEDDDYSLKFLQEDRYHYTTDKNYEFEELNRERRKYDPKFLNENDFKRLDNRYVFRLNKEQRARSRVRPRLLESSTERPVIKVTITNDEVTTPKVIKLRTTTPTVEELEIQTNAIELTTEKASIDDVVEFRTPPTLETIDFETKPINKDKFYTYSDFSDKVSSYSDAKTPQYSAKEKDSKIKMKVKPKDEIETVFARSKVVTYGRQSSEDTNDSLLESDDDISQYEADDKTVVLARSVDDGFW